MRLLLVVSVLSGLCAAAEAAPCNITGADVVISGGTCQLSGIITKNSFTVTGNATVEVSPYTSGNKALTGNLEIRAKTITIDAGSKITARGAGYVTPLCGNGVGPTADAGGRGGCSVRDSGGGGAHFGIGGRGTIDNPTQFPRDYEQDCSAPRVPAPPLGGRGITVTYTGSVAVCHDGNAAQTVLGSTHCNTIDGSGSSSTAPPRDNLPNVNGIGFYHSIYTPEFGGSGGDKGCLDGDGKDPAAGGTSKGLMVGGNGGGRIVLAGVDATVGVATVTVNGTLDANGKRGCGIGNDSGGGGAGGTVFVVGEQVNIGATALITAAGGLGGDTQGLATDPTGECAAPFQQNTTADDCGGGGGGGIVSVLSVNATINDEAVFSVNGAAGGVSTLCRGEAGGGVGELQISNSYVGEFCDGFDNDFDDLVDEGLPDLTCPGFMGSVPSCTGGIPQQCPADVPACIGPVTDSRARFAVVLDTSGSMLGTLAGVPTFGDGSTDHPGRDFDSSNGTTANDSRLFKAKNALTSVIAGYPDIDFALARYHQDQLLNRSCQLAHNFECNAICCTYDNPIGNTAPAPNPACVVNAGTATPMQTVLKNSAGDECINYAGSCGPPRRGADVVVGFGADINNYLMWLDGHENNFVNTETPGAYCDFPTGDCEMRGTGPTPLANSLNAIEDYLTPIKACDNATVLGCRKYGVILLTDGAESCQGNPVQAATDLRNKGISTYVIGFSAPGDTAQLNAIAAAGGTNGGLAFIATDENSLANALAQIVSNSIVFETCNNLDDDCDTRIDEGFTKGGTCDNGQQGVCRRTGTNVCRADGQGTQCDAVAVTPGSEGTICNGLDDDCDGKIDEGITGCTCIPQGETCNNMDDNCNGLI
ncbi:MAG: VWA domain-containing protein, partial [Proteobacteria bacterium]|nr:VWA domain-containing protein [Pseudomonadota bacterium]